MLAENMPDALPGTGGMGGINHSDYKRAVIRAAPQHFFVRVLPPSNVGGNMCYGLRVCPVLSDNQSSTSNGSHREYDVWRRWEDCLWFQNVLEYEYAIMARSKRGRLAAGKGIKRDGVYIHSDGAASFDSLPPGPEASSVALDIHDIVPKLTKKGTFFRPSQATVEQRGREFKTMIEALLNENVPTLVVELREIRVVRDFFGIWRRDTDNERKEAGARKKAADARGRPRASISSSTLSMYFSHSNVSLPGVDPDSDISRTTFRSRSGSDAGYSNRSVSSRSNRAPRSPSTAPMTFTVAEDGALTSPIREHVPRNGLRSAPIRSLPRWSVAASSACPSGSPSDASGVPIMFVSRDQRIQARMIVDRHPESGLQPLSEDEELHESISTITLTMPVPRSAPIRRPRGDCAPERVGSNGVVSGQASHAPEIVSRNSALTVDSTFFNDHTTLEILNSSGPGSSSSERSSAELSGFSERSSRRTSAASITSIASSPSSGPDGSSSDVDKASPENLLPPQTPQVARKSYVPRDSLATVDSFIASSVMESMLSHRPSSPRAPDARRSFSVGDRQVCLSSEAIPCDSWDDRDEIMAAYFYDPTLRPVAEDVQEEIIPLESLPEQYRTQSMVSSVSTPDRYPKPYQHRPPGQFHLPWNPQISPLSEDVPSALSSSGPISPVYETSTFPTTFTIKAVKEDAIVLLRADSTMQWLDVRGKIAEKFHAQEGVPLTKSFLIGYIPIMPADNFVQANGRAAGVGRPRASSTSSVGLLQARGIRTIHSDDEWQSLIAGSNGKLALRILDRF